MRNNGFDTFDNDAYSIADMLAPRENMLWQGAPDRFCYVLSSCGALFPIAIIWLIFDGGFISIMLSTGAVSSMMWFIIPFFLLHLMPVWLFIGKLAKARLGYKNVAYAITDKRVIMRDGLVGIDFRSVDFAEIENISVNVGLIAKLRGVGTIVIKSGQTTYMLAAVSEPYEVFKMLQKSYFDVKTDIQYPNAQRPQNNPGYDTGYEPKR